MVRAKPTSTAESPSRQRFDPTRQFAKALRQRRGVETSTDHAEWGGKTIGAFSAPLAPRRKWACAELHKGTSEQR
jgi:hypothetical protein